MSRVIPISVLADQILNDVAAQERIKTAELAAANAAIPTHHTDLGRLIHKVAEELRTTQDDITYNDLRAVARGRK